MTEEGKREKKRIFHIYTKLCNGYAANKAEAAQNYCANERSLQRDIDEKRTFLSADSEGTGIINSVVYDQIQIGYHSKKRIYNTKLHKIEIIEIGKILSAICYPVKKEMKAFQKLAFNCVCLDRMLINEFIAKGDDYGKTYS